MNIASKSDGQIFCFVKFKILSLKFEPFNLDQTTTNMRTSWMDAIQQKGIDIPLQLNTFYDIFIY